MENMQKIKLLKLAELLRQDTDEQNPMRTNDVLAALGEMGIPCDRRTLAADVKLLNEQGYEVMTCVMGHQKAYYVEDRSFSAPELKVLIDAVQAAGFITEKKSAELTDKIAALGGSHRAELMKGSMVCFNTRKHTNESIFYNIDTIERAIGSRHRVSFRYFDLDEHGERVYRNNMDRYLVDPAALVYMEDNYYLLSFGGKYEGVTTFRVDRMDSVDEENTPIVAESEIAALDLSGYTKQAFRMYGGETQYVTLRFQRQLLGAVYDKFGEGLEVRSGMGGNLCARVNVQVSPTFFGWLTQFAGKMTLISPPDVVEDYREHLQKVLDAMEE